MAEILNLRQARKSKARAEAAAVADANRARFGRSKAEKRETAARDALAMRRLDGHKRTPDGDG